MKAYATDTAIYRPTATLTVVAPPAEDGRTVTIEPRGTVIGRDAGCDLAIAGEHLSRRHAAVRPGHGTTGEYEVVDLGSANGTRINGELIAGPSPLRDGDRLTLADVELGFRIGDRPWERRSLPRELREAPGFSPGALLLAVLGSVVGAVLTGVLSKSDWGTLAGAALLPVVSTIFTTRRAGEKGRVRAAAIVILSLIALFVTWGGFRLVGTLPAVDRNTTFPQFPELDAAKPPETPKPVAELDPVDCGGAGIGEEIACSAATIRYNGGGRLHITRVEVTGRDARDFTAGPECTDAWLSPGETCQLTLRFRPGNAGKRQATLVIHQNLPKPDRGTRASLAGVGNG
ncbi:FHA domain-containing protein [Paractinoplanes globisporus]|uniref:FHA domain-containing protein n=1 Tax=Paractinoplanes globisporus TaxID=113565 RepID=A0ABW6WUV3_9ACTN|nr:FHA domain-containing protein [Actinoplanes globisporus]